MKIAPILSRHAFVCLFVSIIIYSNNSVAQCSNSGARSGSVFTDNNAIGSFAFSSPGNAATSDNISTSASAIASLFVGNTHYLEAKGFGFAIPPSASICGIVVEVQKNATGINLFASVEDNSVRLIKGGTITGNNYATSTNWTTSSSYYSYGGGTDKWGTTWSVADINSANFGVAFSAQISGLVSLFPSAHIDHIRITVYFNIVLPTTVSEFKATSRDDHTAHLQWKMLTSEDNTTVDIERKTSISDWQTLHSTVYTKSGTDRQYEFIDSSCSPSQANYRLKIQSGHGDISYSNIISVRWDQPSLSIYPNPAKDEFFIRYLQTTQSVYCAGTDGRSWQLRTEKRGPMIRADISHLPVGMYVVSVDGKKGLLMKE